MMKRFFIFFVAVMALALVFAPHTQAQNESRWGVMAGANFNNIHFKQNNFMDTKMGVGPMVGVTGELNIAGVGFAIDGSLLYSMRSGKINYGAHTVWSSIGLGDETCQMHYLDVPLNVKFKYHNLGGFENKIKPMIAIGPTFSFLMGKNLGEVNEYRPVSVLLHGSLGAELFNRVQVQVGYSFSIGETLRTRLLDENIAKNRCWNVSVAFYFK